MIQVLGSANKSAVFSDTTHETLKRQIFEVLKCAVAKSANFSPENSCEECQRLDKTIQALGSANMSAVFSDTTHDTIKRQIFEVLKCFFARSANF